MVFRQWSARQLAVFQRTLAASCRRSRRPTSSPTTTLGLPESVAQSAQLPLQRSPTPPCLGGWGFNVPTNTPGGDLQGVEISYQQPFSFLPGVFRNFGVILNYTYVDSKSKYLQYLNTTGVALSQNRKDAGGTIENERTRRSISTTARSARAFRRRIATST